MSMDQVQQKIKFCIDNNYTALNLNGMKLSELPSNLPTFLEYLFCSHNNLKELPANLPGSLKVLYCKYNKINKLPKNLPSSLKELVCCHNNLKELPSTLPCSLKLLQCMYMKISHLPSVLPDSLEELQCGDNQLTNLPKLPISLQVLYCDDNKYLHISKDIALRFHKKETPNYNQNAIIIQRTWRKIKYKQIIVKIIIDNDNVLSNSFKTYGDLNIIYIIAKYGV